MECNAITYCNSSSGCGGGCQEYQGRNPQVFTEDTLEPKGPLPILGFGPWPPGYGDDGCHYSPNLQKHTDQWPHGLCTLKKVADTANPKFWSINADEGWISATFEVDDECQAVSVAACEACKGSSDPQKCLQCAACAKRIHPAGEALGRGAPQVSCSRCFHKDVSDPMACSTCLREGAECAKCLLQYEEPFRVDSCLHCVAENGPGSFDRCGSCAFSRDPWRCSKCLQRVKHNLCTDPLAGPFSGCIPPWVSICLACVDNSGDYETCVACAEKVPWNQDCADCADLRDQEKKALCYSCTTETTSSAHPGSCFYCLRSAPPPVNSSYDYFSSCRSCWMGESVVSGGCGRECESCLARYQDDPGKVEKCMGCVKQSCDYNFIETCSGV